MNSAGSGDSSPLSRHFSKEPAMPCLTSLTSLAISFQKLTKRLASAAFGISAACVFLMMLPVVMDVLMRLLAHQSIPGIVEIEELCMLLLIMTGLAWPQSSGGHIQVEILMEHVPQSIREAFFLFHSLVMTLFSAFLAWHMALSTVKKFHEMEVTMDLSMPLWPFFGMAAAGAAILCLCVLAECLRRLAGMLDGRRLLAIACVFTAAALFLALPWLLKGGAFTASYWLLGCAAFGLLIALLLLQLPIAFAMGLVGILGLMLIRTPPMAAVSVLGIMPFSVSMSFVMTVIPMFILMGEFALHAKISEELFDAASVWLGALPGGLAIASVAGCAGFAAICGDSLATGMTMASVALPEMNRHGYHKGLSCACLAAGGTLGILIPPSIGFIFYSIITEESLGRLFLAGVVPGVMLAAIFSTMVVLMALRHPDLAPRSARSSMGQKIRAVRGVFPMLALVMLVLGGMLGGLFSPTEGGAVGAFGTLLYALVKRSISRKNFVDSLKSTAFITAKLMFILVGVNILGSFLAITRLPFELADAVLATSANKYLIFMLIVALYLILGCMMNIIPLMLLTLPAIFPTVTALGFDPVWFGVVTVLLMEMGLITPPVGMVVFGISGMPGAAPMMSIFRFVLPFVIAMLTGVAMMTAFPQIALFLPNLLM